MNKWEMFLHHKQRHTIRQCDVAQEHTNRLIKQNGQLTNRPRHLWILGKDKVVLWFDRKRINSLVNGARKNCQEMNCQCLVNLLVNPFFRIRHIVGLSSQLPISHAFKFLVGLDSFLVIYLGVLCGVNKDKGLCLFHNV